MKIKKKAKTPNIGTTLLFGVSGSGDISIGGEGDVSMIPIRFKVSVTR